MGVNGTHWLELKQYLRLVKRDTNAADDLSKFLLL